MKSRTSSCKAVAFRKDITRFLPVWALYLLFLVFVQILMEPGGMDYWYANNIAQSIQVLSIMNLFYGFAVAVTLFGDLYQTRLCNGIHSLPLKRQQWFGVHIASGLLFSLIPTALMALFCELVLVGCDPAAMADAWQIPLYWWGAVNLQYLFFFSLAALCVMLAGNRLGAAALYGIVNFISVLLFVLVDQIYVPLLFGVVVGSALFERFCPVVRMSSAVVMDMKRIPTGNTYIDQFGVEQKEYLGEFSHVPESWAYLAVLAVVGLILLLLALQVYRKRRLEAAGDFLAVRWLEPVFQVLFTVLCGVVLYGGYRTFFGYMEIEILPLLFLGMVAGWFAGRMLLERTTRVFRLKNVLGCGLMVAAMAASLYITSLDPLNVSGWIPEAAELKSVTLSTGMMRHDYTTEDPEEIQDLIRLHELALEERAEVHPDYSPYYYDPDVKDAGMAFISLHYYPEKGLPVYREYYITAAEVPGEIVREYAGRLEVVFADGDIKTADDLRKIVSLTESIYLSGREVPGEKITEEFLSDLAEALIADCETRSMVQVGAFHPEQIVADTEKEIKISQLYLDLDGIGMFFPSVEVYADCEHTLEVLRNADLLGEFLMEAYG